MVLAILAFFVCWPLALAAYLNARQVGVKYQQGDYAGATMASARAWMHLRTIGILYAVLLAVGAVGGVLQLLNG